MLEVVEINAIDHLEAIRLRWTSLLYQTRGASFFHTLDWLKLYCRHAGDCQRLRVLLVHRGGTVVGILPLVLRHDAAVAGSPDVLTYPTIQPGHSCGPLGPNPTATLMASLRHLAGQPRDWDVLSLPGLGEHDHGRTASAMELAGFSAREEVHAVVSQVCFDASWADTHVRWPSKAVDHPRQLARDVAFERLRPLGSAYGEDQSLDGFVGECFAKNQHTSSGHQARTALLREMTGLASRLGMLDLVLLRLNDCPIAFSINVHFDGVIQQLCAGETAASLNFRPASMLTLQMLRDSFSRKDRCFHFTPSNGDATRFATRRMLAVRYEHRTSLPLRKRLARFGRWLYESPRIGSA